MRCLRHNQVSDAGSKGLDHLTGRLMRERLAFERLRADETFQQHMPVTSRADGLDGPGSPLMIVDTPSRLEAYQGAVLTPSTKKRRRRW